MIQEPESPLDAGVGVREGLGAGGGASFLWPPDCHRAKTF